MKARGRPAVGRAVVRWLAGALLIAGVVVLAMASQGLGAPGADTWVVQEIPGYPNSQTVPDPGGRSVCWLDDAWHPHVYDLLLKSERVFVPGNGAPCDKALADETGRVLFNSWDPQSDKTAFYLVQPGAGTAQQVTSVAGLAKLCAFEAGFAVWMVQDNVRQAQVAYLYSCVSGSTTEVVADSWADDYSSRLSFDGFGGPALVDGTRVVWMDTPDLGESTAGKTGRIACYSIAGGGVVTLSDPAEDCHGPVVAGGAVAWTAYEVGGSHKPLGVRMWKDIGGLRTFNNGGVVCDTDGRYVLWQEKTTTTGLEKLVVYDLVTNTVLARLDTECLVAIGNRGSPVDPQGRTGTPRVDAGRVAFIRYGAELVVYDIAAGSAVAVTPDDYSKWDLEIAGDYLFWTDTNFGQMYGARRTAAVTTTSASSTTTTSGSTTTTASTTTTTSGSTTTTTTVPGGVGFSDVGPGHRYLYAIVGMASLGIINGYPDGTFRPNNPVLRKHFAKMIVGAMGLSVSEQDWQDANPPFRDCGPDDLTSTYPHDFIAVARAYGLTQGKTATTFAPDADITRAQMVTMVVRAAQNFGISLDPVDADYYTWGTLRDYNDPTHGANARLAEHNGLLDGLQGSGSVSSWMAGNATRGEVAQVLWNLMQK